VLDKWHLHIAKGRSNELSKEERLTTFNVALAHMKEIIYREKMTKLWLWGRT